LNITGPPEKATSEYISCCNCYYFTETVYKSVMRYTDNESFIVKDMCLYDGSRAFSVVSVGGVELTPAKIDLIKKYLKEMGWDQNAYYTVGPNCKDIQKKVVPPKI